MKSRTESRKSACINNLRLIDHAKQQLGTSTNWQDATPMQMSDVQVYLKTTPVCPIGGNYIVGLLATNPVCDYGNGRSLYRIRNYGIGILVKSVRSTYRST